MAKKQTKKAQAAAAKAAKEAEQKATKGRLKKAVRTATPLDDMGLNACVLKEVKESAVHMDAYALNIVCRQREAAGDDRVAAENRVRSHQQGKSQQSVTILLMITNTFQRIENTMTKVLGYWCDAHPVARYFLQFRGLGAVNISKIFSFINFAELPETAGHLWSYFGMVPSIKWIGKKSGRIMREELGVNPDSSKALDQATVDKVLDHFSRISGVKRENLERSHQNVLYYDHKNKCNRKQPLPATGESLYRAVSRRPWNAHAKKSLHIAVDGLVKAGLSPDGTMECYYMRMYRDRKCFEVERNETGHYADTAAMLLKTEINTHKDRATWKEGRLSAGHIDGRARRWVKKILLSHIHQVAYVWRYGAKPPKPFAITQLGHAHVIEPPNIATIQAFLAECEDDIMEKYGVDQLPDPSVKSQRGPTAYEIMELQAEMEEEAM